MLPSPNTSDEQKKPTSTNLEETTTAITAEATAQQDHDSSDDELSTVLPQEYLRSGDIIGYYMGIAGDNRFYREAQITVLNTLDRETPMTLNNGYVITTGCMGKRIIKRTCINNADYCSNLYRDLDDFTLVDGRLHASDQLPSAASEFNSILHRNLMNNVGNAHVAPFVQEMAESLVPDPNSEAGIGILS